MTLVHTLAVAEYLNFRHAANALGVAQSSVSARVKALEEDLGILLFERYARGVRLTEAGRHFVERVAVGIDQLDHAVKTAGMAAAGECGRLRIGIHALIPGSFLVELRNIGGLASARARGRKGGRKFALTKAQVRLAQAAMAQRDTSVSDLCKELGIERVTLYRYVGPKGELRDHGKHVLGLT